MGQKIRIRGKSTAISGISKDKLFELFEKGDNSKVASLAQMEIIKRITIGANQFAKTLDGAE